MHTTWAQLLFYLQKCVFKAVNRLYAIRTNSTKMNKTGIKSGNNGVFNNNFSKIVA